METVDIHQKPKLDNCHIAVMSPEQDPQFWHHVVDVLDSYLWRAKCWRFHLATLQPTNSPIWQTFTGSKTDRWHGEASMVPTVVQSFWLLRGDHRFLCGSCCKCTSPLNVCVIDVAFLAALKTLQLLITTTVPDSGQFLTKSVPLAWLQSILPYSTQQLKNEFSRKLQQRQTWG